MTKVKSALVKVEAGLVNVAVISDTASMTKMVEMRREKISSVNRVRYFTKFEADVKDEMSKIVEVHKPVHAYNGRKGRFIDFESWNNAATNARTGPVDPMIVNGCADNNAYKTPHAAVEETISIVPIAPLVATAKRPPKPTAGAKQAKKRNMVAATHCMFSPSMMSETYKGSLPL